MVISEEAARRLAQQVHVRLTEHGAKPRHSKNTEELRYVAERYTPDTEVDHMARTTHLILNGAGLKRDQDYKIQHTATEAGRQHFISIFSLKTENGNAFLRAIRRLTKT